MNCILVYSAHKPLQQKVSEEVLPSCYSKKHQGIFSRCVFWLFSYFIYGICVVLRFLFIYFLSSSSVVAAATIGDTYFYHLKTLRLSSSSYMTLVLILFKNFYCRIVALCRVSLLSLQKLISKLNARLCRVFSKCIS